MTNEMILRKFLEKVWNNKEYHSVEEFVYPAYTIHLDNGDPWEHKTIDLDTFRKRLHYSFDSFPDLHFEIRTAISDGDHVAITWVMTGTNLGMIGGFPATGKFINTEGATIYFFTDGKVSGHSQVFDRTTVMKQLGFI
jgi:steroid delta-isomerase-like uncharacterized protein